MESGIKTDKQTSEEYLQVVFEEQNELPVGYLREEYESKGFFCKSVPDFPLRGRVVFLELRRRRWRHKVSGELITRDLTFLADGTTLTAELADFL